MENVVGSGIGLLFGFFNYGRVRGNRWMACECYRQG